jgi:hypothetical protein
MKDISKIPEFLCDMCGSPMELTKLVGTKQSGRKYRQRWFRCIACGYEKKVYSWGFCEEVIEPRQAIGDINKMFKKEEDART